MPPESKLGTALLIGAIVAPFTGIGLLAGPIVWILAAGEKKKIASGELAPSGAVTGALVIGIIETVLLVLLILFVISLLSSI